MDFWESIKQLQISIIDHVSSVDAMDFWESIIQLQISIIDHVLSVDAMDFWRLGIALGITGAVYAEVTQRT
jgi:hypothetical protein